MRLFVVAGICDIKFLVGVIAVIVNEFSYKRELELAAVKILGNIQSISIFPILRSLFVRSYLSCDIPHVVERKQVRDVIDAC